MSPHVPHVYGNAVRGAGSMALAMGLAKLAAIGLLLLFARLLNSTEYGTVTLAFVILGMLTPLRDLGLNQAAVYFRSEEAIDFSASVRLASSVLLFLGLGVIVWSFPSMFGGESGRIVVLLILASMLMLALSFSSEIRLSREVRFGSLVAGDVARSFTYFGLTALLVFSGWGILGVAVAYTSSFFVRTFVLHRIEPIRFKFRLGGPGRDQLVEYGTAVTVSGLSGLLISNIDSLVVAAYFGAGVLGYYAMAWNWATLVALQAAFVLHQVMFPTFVVLRGTPEAVRSGTERAVSLAASFAFPISALLFASPEPFVKSLLGDAWLACIPFIPVFAVYAAARAIFEPLPSGFLAMGKPKELARINVMHAILVSVSVFVGAIALGPFGVAIAVMSVYLVIATAIALAAQRVLGIPLTTLLRLVGPQAIAACIVALGLFGMISFIFRPSSLLELALVYAIFGLAFLAASAMFSKGRTLREVKFVVNALLRRGLVPPGDGRSEHS